ncbi:MAG: hypothetical protein VX403_09245, partial [Planctomycetota bacterium]|nr:hypothetical protein [Planctomycetota bacterium]
MTRHDLQVAAVATCVLCASPAWAGGDAPRFERLPDGYANGVSDDGSLVVGERFGLGAFAWTLDGVTNLGGSAAVAVGGDGRYVAGNASGASFGDSAGRHDLLTGDWWLLG